MTTQPTNWLTHLQDLQITDPLVRNIILGAAAFMILILALRVLSRRSAERQAARERARLRRGYDELRLQQEEIERLASRIIATSSTQRIAGFGIVRQVETVFSEPRPNSVQAVDLCKARAAQKGANALINLNSQQAPTGKWVASGDAVIVKPYGQRSDKSPEKKPPQS